MNQTQKAALYGLMLTLFMLLIPAVDLIDTKVNPILLRVVGYSLAVVLVIPVYFIQRRRKHKTPFDERDKQICVRAFVATIGLLAVSGVAAYVVAYLWLPDFVLARRHLPILVYSTAIGFIFVLSISVLVQYFLPSMQRSPS